MKKIAFVFFAAVFAAVSFASCGTEPAAEDLLYNSLGDGITYTYFEGKWAGFWRETNPSDVGHIADEPSGYEIIFYIGTDDDGNPVLNARYFYTDSSEKSVHDINNWKWANPQLSFTAPAQFPSYVDSIFTLDKDGRLIGGTTSAGNCYFTKE